LKASFHLKQYLSHNNQNTLFPIVHNSAYYDWTLLSSLVSIYAVTPLPMHSQQKLSLSSSSSPSFPSSGSDIPDSQWVGDANGFQTWSVTSNFIAG
jgi:hypothetical protein